MEDVAIIFFSLGSMFLLGLATDYLGRHSFLPRVTLLLALGIVVGDDVLGLIPSSLTNHFDVITNMTLLMVGFVLGGKLDFTSLKADGGQIVWISIGASLGTAVIVAVVLAAVGMPPGIAVLLGCIAAATDAASTVDTALESGKQTRFSRILLAVVTIDDVWALILFSLGLALVSVLNGGHGAAGSLMEAAYHVGGAILLGALIGVPAAYLTGRLQPGKPMLTEALGLVFTCGGAALWLDVSFLIAAVTMGAVIANLARHHDYPFHEIENIEWPLMLVFFVLAGASLEIHLLSELGVIGAVYLLSRGLGKVLGARLGGQVSHASPAVKQWMGVALLPQAGVAIGMALLAANRYPDYQQTILLVVISSTIVFELFGPICTKIALVRTSA